MKKLSLFAALLLTGLAFSAQATTIDFTTMPDGNVSTIGNATFSLAGVGEAGDPFVDGSFGGGLWNSSDSASYPTNTILRVDFATSVTNLSWTFDNEGGKNTSYTIFDSAMNVLASGSNLTGSGFQSYDFSTLTDVSRIDWNNNGNNWLFALGEISYDAVSVPEPASLLLLGLGLVGIGVSKRKQAA